MSKGFKRETLQKRWILKERAFGESHRAVSELTEKLGVSETMAKLLVNRGYEDAESAHKFIHMESELLCDPFELADIRPAMERIQRAEKNGERVVIYGDYDVDGVTAVCTLYLYLRARGVSVSYYIPNRLGEGYGVSRAALDRFKEEGITLMITVDTGITAYEEIAFASSLGIDTVVTDHHECRCALPPAVAVVNPHRPDCPYPFKDLAGVGVVFKLICAYEEFVTGDTKRECVARLCQEYADLVAIGTIADVMPIRDENKLIVSYGLRRMEKKRRLGLSALMDAASPKAEKGSKRTRGEGKITSGYIGFTIAPRINAAGRLRSASLAVELFLAEDREMADEIAAALCEANRERQAEENRIITEAYEKIDASHNFDTHPVIVLDANNWHHGVIGIVSSRITEKYGLPSILVSFEGCEGEERGTDVGKGSGRSIKGMNLVDALVHCEEHLLKHGGHELAAGLSVTREALPVFREKINEYAKAHLREEDIVPSIEADCVLALSDINMDLASELRMLEPYGVANPLPVFAMYSALLEEIVPVSGGKHTRLILSDGDSHVTAMYFSKETDSLDFYQGERVDILFCIDINEWYGRRSVQLIVKDMRSAEREARQFIEEKERFDAIFGGAEIEAEEDVIPDRDDFAAVYTVIRCHVRGGENTLSMRRMLSLLHSAGTPIGYIKLKLIFRILEELNLLGIEEIEGDVFRFRIQFTANKVDLEKSGILRRLRSRVRRHSFVNQKR